MNLPPQNLEAEEAILARCMISPGDIDDMCALVAPGDFYRSAHQKIFAAIVELSNKKIHPDLPALSGYLRDNNRLEEIGGATYLARLVDSVAMSTNNEHFCNIIKGKSVLRQLIEKSNTIARTCYESSGDAADVLDVAQREILSIDIDSDVHDFTHIKDMCGERIDFYEERFNSKTALTGISSGYPKVDDFTGGFQDTDLIILAGRPSHGKTAMALNLMRNMAKNDGIKSGIFSLEMSKEQLFDRLIAMESRVNSTKFRTGRFKQEQWMDITQAMGEISEWNILFETLSFELPKIIRKARKMKKEGAQIIFVDYLSLVAGDNTKKRHEEVAATARAFKRLAKELSIPVVLMVQLNRGFKDRKNKRPVLYDLRECLTETALLTDADTGERVSIKDVKPGQHILSFDEPLQKIVPGKVSGVFTRGTKQTLKLTLGSGREICGTENHPIYTENGWTHLNEITVGTDIAVQTGGYNSFSSKKGYPSDLCRLLGYMAGDGTCKKHREAGFVANVKDIEVINDFKKIIKTYFPKCDIREKHRNGAIHLSVVRIYENGHGKPYGNPFREFLRDVGMHGHGFATKRVPKVVFSSGKEGMAEFIFGYFHTDGTFKKAGSGCCWQASFASCSKGLLLDVQEMLGRLGIPSKIGAPTSDTRFRSTPLWVLVIPATTESITRFIETIPLRYRKGRLAENAIKDLAPSVTGPGVFGLPRSLSKQLAQITRDVGLPHTETWRDQGKRMRRETALAWSHKLNLKYLKVWAESDLVWDAVVSIEQAGVEKTYDICVEGTHSFIANGIVVHNSGEIEQAADLVAFIYRQELDEKDENHPKNGTAEFIIEKQRNGPLGYVEFFFNKYLTEFAPLTDIIP